IAVPPPRYAVGGTIRAMVSHVNAVSRRQDTEDPLRQHAHSWPGCARARPAVRRPGSVTWRGLRLAGGVAGVARQDSADDRRLDRAGPDPAGGQPRTS